MRFLERAASGSSRRVWDGYWNLQYRRMRGRYDLSEDFSFDGVGINLFGDGEIEIGAGSYLAEWAAISAVEGTSVRIGRDCAVGQYTRIYSNARDVAAHVRGETRHKLGDVQIEDGVWIGMNVYVGPGVTIGAGAVIGANCVVTRNVPPRAVVRTSTSVELRD